MKKVFSVFSILLIILMALPAQAKMKKLGQAGMTFLSIGGSARASGMADVFDFAKNDLASVFYNPAGLATVEKRAFFFNYTQWIADMSVAHMAIAWNSGQYGTFALHAQLMDYGDFKGTAINLNDPRGYDDIDVGDVGGMSIGLGYGISLTERFSIGGNLKWVSQKLGKNDTYVGDVLETAGKENKVSDVAFDFGTMYDTGIKSIVLSMSIRNYAGQQLYENEEFQLPQTYKIGVAANLFEFFPGPAENHKAILAIEGVDPIDRPEFVHLGLEYDLMNMLFLRLGWAPNRAEDDNGGLSAGAGFKLNTEGFVGNVDVSYSDYGSILGSVLRFSISGAL